MYGIEKGIPLPAKLTGKRNSKYNWGGMEVDDSFFVPLLGRDAKRALRSLQTICTVQQRRTNKRYTARLVTENGVQGVRVWRTE